LSAESTVVVTDIDHLGLVISHATAPAFMLGAVAAFLSILIQRMERISDRIRVLRADGSSGADPKEALLQTLDRRVLLLGRAIYFGVLSALVTSALLIAAFASALLGVGHGVIVAAMFVVALALLMTCLVNLALEIRIQLATIGLD
jgi:sterol desaturase/sphingolipid hydroxylase (fatty acid hydroxylase superfamily)